MRAALLLIAIGTSLHAQGAVIDGRRISEPVADGLFLGSWSVAYGPSEWQLDVGPNGRYRLWRVEGGRDTLVASMGAWSVRRMPLGMDSVSTDHLCLVPVNREPMCSRILMDDRGYPVGYRWQFIEAERAEMSWVAYRLGRAPWQLADASAAREEPVLSLNEVTERPRLFRCPNPPSLTADEVGPERLIAELVVEPDSSASRIRIVNAPNAGLAARVEESLRTCEFIPGTLNGRPVRVRVRLPVPLPRQG